MRTFQELMEIVAGDAEKRQQLIDKMKTKRAEKVAAQQQKEDEEGQEERITQNVIDRLKQENRV